MLSNNKDRGSKSRRFRRSCENKFSTFFRNADAYNAVVWLRKNKASVGFKFPEKVYEPMMMHITVQKEFLVQVPRTEILGFISS